MKKKDKDFSDKIFYWILKILGYGTMVLLAALVVVLLKVSFPIFEKFGLKFFILNDWNPVTRVFGALPFIYGTVVTSLLAIVIAVPVSIGIALFVTEIANSKIKKILSFLVEMLAAIPSVVYGLWGLFVLVPWLRNSVEPFLGKYLGFIPLFYGAPYGVGVLAAGIILAIMIVPTVSSICREIFYSVPNLFREGALALGATHWEMMKLAVVKSSVSGIFGASILGLGRALGETMAVTMVIGNRPQISPSLFSPAQTLASLIANEYNEASNSSHLAALTAMGLVLLMVSLAVNTFAKIIQKRFQMRTGVGK